MSRTISYRGLLADGGQDIINLHTNDGKTGYKVIKFELIPPAPGVSNGENVVKMYKVEQTTIDGLIDFNDLALLAAGYYTAESSSYSDNETIIFDNEIFNQDIYITNTDARVNGTAINYYIELEQIDLTEDQALVAIVKNLRNEQ